MVADAGRAGRIHPGLIAFLVLLAGVVTLFVYRYADSSARLGGEAVELMNQGKYESALAKLDQAVKDDPEDVRAHYHRGICLTERHRFDEALAAFDRAIQLDPDGANAYFNKGKVLWLLKRWEQALAPLEKATELVDRLEEVNRPEAWRLLGECLYEIHLEQLANAPDQAGSPARALSALKSYLQEGTGATNRQAVRQKVDILSNPERYPQVIERRKKTQWKPR